MEKDMQETLSQLKKEEGTLFEQDVFHIVNGEVMYADFKKAGIIENAQIAPFNEAMCVHKTTAPIFSEAFVHMRAKGHHVTCEDYYKKVMDPLQKMLKGKISCLVLWFGEDVFCQMNVLTVLAYVEESGFNGDVYLQSFEDKVFHITTQKIPLGSFQDMYQAVLMHHEKPTTVAFSVLQRALEEYLQVQNGHHPVISYIKEHAEMPEREMVIQLLRGFPSLGYGNVQYLELMDMYR